MKTELEIRTKIIQLQQEIKTLDKKIDAVPMSQVNSLEKQIEEKNKQVQLLKWVIEI